ncbi:MAG: tetratricopeptide repeat protein [Burkholderiaceae bacterium]|jgi:predicted O-linked N-acetylglucosamine transferase (SPINDLY family)|nr:tetratricopeptide repeat protein [Burkholderiaceae bacterium]
MLWIQSEKIKTALRNKQFNQARSLARAALRSADNKLAHWTDLAGVHVVAGELEQAEQALSQAIKRFNLPTLYSFRAYVRHAGKQFDSALADLRQAERGAPEDVSIQNNLAAALMDRGHNQEAVVYLEKVLSKDPNHADALSNLSAIYGKLKNYPEAIELTRRWLKLQPDNAQAYLMLLDQLRSAGLLMQFQQAFDGDKLKSAFERAQRFHTFHALNYADDPAWHLQLARREASTFAVYGVARSAGGKPGDKAKNKKLRIGYWSCNFHAHAMVQLVAEAFELHDRTQFEIYILSYNPPKPSPERERIMRAADRFLDFHDVDDKTAIEQIAQLDLDILVDLMGYTAHSRMAVSFARPAPIVVNWLGYPSTLGTRKIDYIIGDPVVTPPGCEAFYDERIARLPCYWPNDSTLPVAKPLSRAEYGLPEDAVVLAAFNATHKISPTMFDIWMRVLKRHPQACLWIFAESEAVFRNLAAEAELRGVQASRLVHAGRQGKPEHFARHLVVDLAIDCFPYGSHTTGSDALRVGCPLLALKGKSFPARVSATLLEAAGLPELVTDSFQAYEDKLNEIVQSAPLRQQLRQRLKNVGQSLLFDTPAFVAGLERAYRDMWERYVTQ